VPGLRPWQLNAALNPPRLSAVPNSNNPQSDTSAQRYAASLYLVRSLQTLSYRVLDWALDRFGRISWKNLDRISGILYKLFYQTIEYRRSLVEKHLAQAFPEKNPTARKAIEKDFYQLFADWMMEVSFMYAQDWEAVRERFEIKNLSLFHEAHARGQSVIVAMGHQFNWEWGGWIVRKDTAAPILCVYLPLKDVVFDTLFLRMRGRYGSHMLPQGQMGLRLARMRTTTHTLILMADQSPSDLERAVWLPFLNRLTAWHGGLSRAAHLGNYRVLFVEIRRLERHQYAAYPVLLSDEPRALSAEALTRLYVEHLEASLRRDPANWLWTHNRWKHSPPM
jgi:KDO2-lipid IV(A) lauroyltransferase